MPKELTELTLSDIYRYTALSFRYPEADWFNDDFLTVFFDISQKAGFTEEVAQAKHIFTEPNWLETAQVEYTRLFVTAAAGVVASPYGSIYIDGNGLLYDKFTDKIAKFYLQKGFELRDAQQPPDYLVYQLEFMAMLEHDALRAEQSNNRTFEQSNYEQKEYSNLDSQLHQHNDRAGLEEFISDYFRPWFEPFMKIVYAETTHPYFILITKLVDFFTATQE